MENNYMQLDQEKILDSLHALDARCIEQQIQAEMIVLGGSGILLFMEENNQYFRPTRDIDVNILATDDENLLTESLKGLNIYIVGGVMEVPPLEDFKRMEYRFELDAGFSNIRVYVPDIEMLACSKVFSTREKDLNDLRETNILNNCDKEKLSKMIEEYKEYHTYPENPDLNLHQLVHILHEKGIQ